MAWRLLQEGKYVLRLTDGYLTDPTTVSRSDSAGESIEQAMAERIYRLANRRYAASVGSGKKRPDPLDVWVIGAPGWLSRDIPEPLRSICEAESSNNYRIIIAGEGLEGIRQPHVPGWQGWTYAAGMKRKKRHDDLASFQDASDTLLGVMHDYYDETGFPPTEVLRGLAMPLAHAGASGHNRDVLPSNRIQQ